MAIAHVRARVDPDDPLEIPLAPMVAWYRVDASRRIAGYLAIGATAMTIGMFAVAGFIIGRATVPALVSGVTGILLVIVGGAATIAGTMRVMWEESYLALRTDGVLFVHGDRRRYARWDDVDGVRHDAERKALVIVRAESEWVLTERFAGATHEEIAKTAGAIRRKARMGMYGRACGCGRAARSRRDEHARTRDEDDGRRGRPAFGAPRAAADAGAGRPRPSLLRARPSCRLPLCAAVEARNG